MRYQGEREGEVGKRIKLSVRVPMSGRRGREERRGLHNKVSTYRISDR